MRIRYTIELKISTLEMKAHRGRKTLWVSTIVKYIDRPLFTSIK